MYKLCENDLSFCRVAGSRIDELARGCTPSVSLCRAACRPEYSSERAFVYLPFDRSIRERVRECVNGVAHDKPSTLVVVGIGGSNLGTLAVYEAITGRHRPCRERSIQAIFAETVDPDDCAAIKNYVEARLKAGEHVTVNIVTKSGTTTETLANGALLCEVLKNHYGQKYHDHVVVTTDTGSPLAHVAYRNGMRVLEVPRLVGGRYSVLSAVGLFPLGLLGIDLDALCSGAEHMTMACLEADTTVNDAARSAALMYDLYERGYFIHNFFTFSTDLYGLGLWYRQLVAESLGKECSLSGTPVSVGITPTVSLGSTDLHSLVQRELAGPSTTLTTFVGVRSLPPEPVIPSDDILAELVPHIAGTSCATLQNAMLEGTKKAYATRERPFTSVTLAEKSAESIGQFLQWKMLEIVYLAHLFDINPFDQPHVQLYKDEIKHLLADEHG